ncbi:MAG TPA: TIGR02757 family protein [Phycisphaerae bacterium]|nr:TIGR02757 family protein [Phycisphaerae bacterium]
MTPAENAETLEGLYRRLNRRRYIHPDPLEFLHDYDDQADLEVVALVASSLAVGRVSLILKSVSIVLKLMGPNPARYLSGATQKRMVSSLDGFKHRFITGRNVIALLTAAKQLIKRYGSLRECFIAGMRADDETVLGALKTFAGRLIEAGDGGCGWCVPDPLRNSACKRLNLMLRWLVRQDEVDPGGWTCVGAEKLIVPLDTHMHKIGLAMGATRRKSADMRTALEITGEFRRISPNDPVKYDFALTRLGIRDEMDLPALLAQYADDTRERAYA